LVRGWELGAAVVIGAATGEPPVIIHGMFLTAVSLADASATSGVTSFQLVTLCIAILGVVVAGSSLTWQVVAFALAGSRVQVQLLAGALMEQSGGTGMASGPLNDFDPDVFITQGARRFYFVVRAANVGRLPISITGAQVVNDKGWGYSVPGDPINPATPYRLESGSQVNFYVAMNEVREIQRINGASMLSAEVTLATAKTLRSRRHKPGSWLERV
jgi:hypothetical protein